jgi:hypothetical protein
MGFGVRLVDFFDPFRFFGVTFFFLATARNAGVANSNNLSSNSVI